MSFVRLHQYLLMPYGCYCYFGGGIQRPLASKNKPYFRRIFAIAKKFDLTFDSTVNPFQLLSCQNDSNHFNFTLIASKNSLKNTINRLQSIKTIFMYCCNRNVQVTQFSGTKKW